MKSAKAKTPDNAPKRGTKVSSPTKMSPTSMPRWIVRWHNCASSIGHIDEESKQISPRMNRPRENEKLRLYERDRLRALPRGNKAE